MQKKRTKLNRMVPFFLGGFLVLGGCSVFGAGEPIKQIDEEEAAAFEEGYLYIYREKPEEEIYLEQLEEAFSNSNVELLVFNIREHTDFETARISDYGLNQDYQSVAFYEDGEKIDQADMSEISENENVQTIIGDFIERNKN